MIESTRVTTKNGIDVKLVFVKNYSISKDYLVLISTDISPDNQEIIRLYGNRWSIKAFLKPQNKARQRISK